MSMYNKIEKSLEYTTVTVWTDEEDYKIDLTNEGFYIDLIDALWTTYCSAFNYPQTHKHFRIDKNNYTKYIGNDFTSLGQNGIEFYLVDDRTLVIRILERQIKNDNDEPIGFCDSRMIVSFDYEHTTYQDDSYNPMDFQVDILKKEKRNYLGVEISPKLYTVGIELLDETKQAQDPQLKETERRPDFVFNDDNNKDNMYVNTSAGTSLKGEIGETYTSSYSTMAPEECVPIYVVKTSAYIPYDFYKDVAASGTEPCVWFDFTKIDSYIENILEKQNIEYEITNGTIEEGILEEYVSEINSKNKRKNFCWEIKQYITTDKPLNFINNKIVLDIPMSGIIFSADEDA